MFTTTGATGRRHERGHHGVGGRRRGGPPLVGQHVVPSLAFDATVGYRLAHGDTAHAARPSRQGGADRTRVVDGPAHVGAGVDSRHDQVEGRPERPQAGEHDTHRRGAGDRPRLADTVHWGAVDLGLEEVKGTERGARSRVLRIRGRDHDLAPRRQRPSEDVKAERIDAVVIGHENAHPIIILENIRRIRRKRRVRQTAHLGLPGKGGLVAEDVGKPDAAQSDVDAEQSDLEGVEVITAVIRDDGTVVIDDLVAEVDEEGHIVATDERLEIDKPDGTVIVDETFSIAGDDGELRAIDEETTVTEP